MAEQVIANASPDGGANGAATSAAQTSANPVDAGQAQPIWRNEAEVKAYFKRVQALEDELKAIKGTNGNGAGRTPEAPAPAVKADAMTEVQALRAEIALRDAIADTGVQMSPEQRAIVKRLYKAEQPQDVEAWLKGTATGLGIGAKAPAAQAPAAAPAAAPAPSSNTGAAVVDPKTGFPMDPHVLAQTRPDVWQKLARKDRIAMFEADQSRSGMNSNMFSKT